MKIFGWEITVAKETTFPNAYNWWECKECGETGKFSVENDLTYTFYPSGFYEWKTYPAMRCKCRRDWEGLP